MAILVKKQGDVDNAKNKMDFFTAMFSDLQTSGNEKMQNIFIPKFFPDIKNDDYKNDVEYNAFNLNENILNKPNKELTPEENATKANFLIALGKRMKDLSQIYQQRSYLPKELTLMSYGSDFRVVAGYSPNAERGYSFFMAYLPLPKEPHRIIPTYIDEKDQQWIVSYSQSGAYEAVPQEKEKDPTYVESFYMKIALKFMDKLGKFLNKTLHSPLGLQQEHQKASDSYEQKLAVVNDLQEALEIAEKEFNLEQHQTLLKLVREDKQALNAVLSVPEKKNEIVELKHKEYAEKRGIKL
ncbi:hypothetical protein ACOWMZ_07610 [Helicobacter pylori]